MSSHIFIGSIVIHCFEFEKMVNFWKEALNYNFREEPTEDWAIIADPNRKGPNLSFEKRDRKRERRNWIHLDLYTADQELEVKRLTAIGAKPYPWRYPPEADYVVLEDPDGNLFCVVKKP
jgi:predicted enzyme related to lactoylglutathione lyase